MSGPALTPLEMPLEIMTISEAAALTRLKVSTLYAYVARRNVPYLKIGNRVLFERAALRKWLTSKRVEPWRVRYKNMGVGPPPTREELALALRSFLLAPRPEDMRRNLVFWEIVNSTSGRAKRYAEIYINQYEQKRKIAATLLARGNAIQVRAATEEAQP